MPFSSVTSAVRVATSIVPVRIEVDIQPGLPYFTIVGFADRRVNEARQRVRSAFRNSGLKFPMGRVTVNLSPADVPKTGACFDLGIAIGILQATGVVPPLPPDVWILGSLSLDGKVVSVPRVVGMLAAAAECRARCILPAADGAPAQKVPECSVLMASTLAELLADIRKPIFSQPSAYASDQSPYQPNAYLIDQVFGQAQAKRALHIALAGGHALFLSGPPGAGKTLLARAAQELLPPLDRSETLEMAKLTGLLDITGKRPFRVPHHSISLHGLIGGGNPPSPGEISLAHLGILFLDELPEFSRRVREALRQPIQDKRFELTWSGRTIEYPARCLVIAAQNNCPCGLAGDAEKPCRCSAGELTRYKRAVSEPLLDRFDVFCPVPRLLYVDWSFERGDKPSYVPGQDMAASIRQARSLQLERQGKLNGDMQEGVQINEDCRAYVGNVSRRLKLTGRGIASIVRVARTIADIEGCEQVTRQHVQEAAVYRRRVED